MSSNNQPHRIFGLTGKELIIVGLGAILACAGISIATLIVSRLAPTVITAINRPTDTPEATRKPTIEVLIFTATPPPTATPRPTFTPTFTPTPTPAPGQSRGQPLSPSAIVQANDWQVQLLESKRGEEAAQLIRAVNQFNPPASDGKEYLLVKLRVKSLHSAGQAHPIQGGDFKLTGDRLTRYLPVGVVPPDPQLQAELLPGGGTEGWIVYEIGLGEDQLMMDFDPLSNDQSHSLFIALKPGTALAVDPELSRIVPTDLGQTYERPAAPGKTLITDDWQVTVLAVVRGDKAYDMARAVNRFNDPPAEGMEYLAVRARVKNLNPADQFVMLDSGSFKTVGDKNTFYAAPAVVDPKPALSAYLYPGGEVEGWIILQIGRGEGHAQIIFDPLFDWEHINRRFIALPE
ncbi:MAG TPA: hypothetical protein VLG46_10950 [Anaerolineae bacterium]|nr:hypothetical protein [Anaerolineae bacterium]